MWKNNSPADSTSCAVKLLLVFVVIELAVKAEVLRVQNEELFNFIVLENKQNKQKLPNENRITKKIGMWTKNKTETNLKAKIRNLTTCPNLRPQLTQFSFTPWRVLQSQHSTVTTSSLSSY